MIQICKTESHVLAAAGQTIESLYCLDHLAPLQTLHLKPAVQLPFGWDRALIACGFLPVLHSEPSLATRCIHSIRAKWSNSDLTCSKWLLLTSHADFEQSISFALQDRGRERGSFFQFPLS